MSAEDDLRRRDDLGLPTEQIGGMSWLEVAVLGLIALAGLSVAVWGLWVSV
jgi:hypothetical protein